MTEGYAAKGSLNFWGKNCWGYNHRRDIRARTEAETQKAGNADREQGL